MTPRQLHEYWITLNYQVEAHDEQEAQEIARDLLNRSQEGSIWKIFGCEVSEIEKAS
jgi:hypothetical protein